MFKSGDRMNQLLTIIQYLKQNLKQIKKLNIQRYH